MALKISELSEQSTLSDSDVLHTRSSGGVDYKITGANVRDSITNVAQVSSTTTVSLGGEVGNLNILFTQTSEITVTLSGVLGTGRILTMFNTKTTNVNVVIGSETIIIYAGGSLRYMSDGSDMLYLSRSSGSGKLLGEIFFSVGYTVESGCLFCRYQELDQDDYAALFAKIGHGFAKSNSEATSAEASNTFHIPDGDFLFPRSMSFAEEITDSDISTTTYEITIANHGFNSSENGMPIKLTRVPGSSASPTMPTDTNGDYEEYSQLYMAYSDANNILLYSNEDAAVDNDGETDIIEWSDAGSGTFLLTTIGCYQADALQELQGTIGEAFVSNISYDGVFSDTAYSSDAKPSGDGYSAYNVDFKASNSTSPTTAKTSAHETRGAYVSLGMQIVVE